MRRVSALGIAVLCFSGWAELSGCASRFDDIPCVYDWNCPEEMPHCVAGLCTAPDAGTGGGASALGARDGGSAAGGGTAFAITFSDACAAAGPCGSPPVGHWVFSSACISASHPWPALRAYCSGATLSELSGTMEGTLDISSTTLTQRSSRTISGKVLLPSACLPPVLPSDGARCSLAEALFKAGADAGFPTIDASSCATTGSSEQGGCVCSVADVRAVDTSGPWVSDGGVLTVRDSQTSAMRTYSSCAKGESFTYRETTASIASDQASYTLH